MEANVKPTTLLFVLLASLSAGVSAELGTGDALPELELEDQHEETHSLPGETRILLFAPDRESGEVVTETLAGLDADALAERAVRYVADISGMPGIITQLFALPKLRERPYPILLGEEAEQTSELPRRAEHVTVLELSDGAITDIRYLNSPSALRQALNLPRTPQ